MLISGELDAAVLTDAALADPRLKTVIPDPAAQARQWQQRNRAIQINHMVVVRESLSKSNPGAVREVYRLLCESKQTAPLASSGGIDMNPSDVEANRRNLEVAIDYAYQQGLLRTRLDVDGLFDDSTRVLLS